MMKHTDENAMSLLIMGDLLSGCSGWNYGDTPEKQWADWSILS